MCLAHHWSSIQRIQSAPSTKTTACFVVSYPTHSGLLGTQTIPCFHPPLLLLLLLLFSYSICWMLDGRITFPSHRDFATVSLQGSHFFPSVGICSGIRKYVSSPDGPLLPASCPPPSIVSSFVLGSAQTLLSAICPYSPCACLGHREKEKEQLFCAVSRGYISQVGNLIRSKSWIPTLSDCLSVSAASNMAPGFHCVTHHLLLQHRAPASDPPTWTTFVTKCTIRRWRNVRAFPRRKKRTELLHVVWRATSLCVKKKKKKPGEGEEDFSRCWGSGRSSRAAHDAGKMLFCIWRVVTGQSRREDRVSACACRHRHGPVDVLAVRLQSKLFLDSSSPVSRLCEQDGQHLRSSFAAAAGRLGVCRLIFVRLRPISLRCRFGRHVWINLGQFHPGTGRQL